MYYSLEGVSESVLFFCLERVEHSLARKVALRYGQPDEEILFLVSA
jgi:hypothetical protein